MLKLKGEKRPVKNIRYDLRKIEGDRHKYIRNKYSLSAF